MAACFFQQAILGGNKMLVICSFSYLMQRRAIPPDRFRDQAFPVLCVCVCASVHARVCAHLCGGAEEMGGEEACPESSLGDKGGRQVRDLYLRRTASTSGPGHESRGSVPLATAL